MYTDADLARVVTPVSQPKKEPSNSLTTSVKTSKTLKLKKSVFDTGSKLWKDAPSAIRFARSRSELMYRDANANDERVDEKLREMCDKAYITGELENKAYTLEEIGDYCGLTRERVRQIQEEALNHVRTEIKESFGWEIDLEDMLPREHRSAPEFNKRPEITY